MKINELRNNLLKFGNQIIPSSYNLDFCNSVVNTINKNINHDNSESLYHGTEIRIWDAQLLDDKIKYFKDRSDELVSNIFKKNIKSYTVLALKNSPIINSTDLQGRWHIDSLRRQIKVFTYLNDVSVLNGTLEIMEKTNTNIFKIKSIFNGLYFNPSDIPKKTRKYQSLSDLEIQNLKKYKNIKQIICNAGSTLIADTSCIHRAIPCLEGERYYLATYYKHI